MRRLIDESELIEIIQGNEELLEFQKDECINCIKACDTAYDQDKVVQQLERLVGYSILKESDGTPLYLDELDPNRGDMNTEIFPDCGIMCYLAQGR